MAKNHIVQHRESERSKVKEIAELKKENHSLKRRVAKLQKYLQKALENSTLQPDPDMPVEATVAVPAESGTCPDCGGNKLVQVQLPHGLLKGCKTCGWKKKV